MSEPAIDEDLNRQIKVSLVWLISVGACIRLLAASLIELGNDEVYYWTYAMYPDWSHFDHPPMVGILAQISTLNLLLSDDFFLRLGPIVLSSASTWMVFKITSKIGSPLAGLFAAYLFSASVYCAIISGFSLTPDAPLVFFWLLAIGALVDLIGVTVIDTKARWKMMSFGLWVGLAMLSKYQGAFLWIGAVLYILFYDRKWIKDFSLYLSAFLSLIVFFPVIFWNYQQQFASFTFHSERVTPALQFRADYLLTELGGQIAYSNPFVWALIFWTIIAIIKKRSQIKTQYQRILLLTCLPVWIIFTGFSLFRATLPHWTGPAYISLVMLGGLYWSEKISQKSHLNPIRPFWIIFPAYFLGILLFIAIYVISYSPFQLGKKSDTRSFGEYDFTQDLYGWNQIHESFEKISRREESQGKMKPGAGLVSTQWFPGAHEDFYIAWPDRRNLFLVGDIQDIHKYQMINKTRGGLMKGEDYYHIVVSNYYHDPHEKLGNYFEKIEPMDTVAIHRGGAVMRYAFFYRLKNYKGKPGNL